MDFCHSQLSRMGLKNEPLQSVESFEYQLDNKKGFGARLRFFIAKRVLSAIFVLICALLGENSMAQSEPQFSGVFLMPTVVNPGAAGRSGALDATAAFRQQWVGFDDAPSQFLIAADAEVKFLKNFHGVGAMVMQDKVGAATTLTLNAAYSYHIYLDKGLLGLGARFGVYNVKFDASDLSTSPSTLPDGYHQETDEALTGADDSRSAFDAGVGAFYQSPASFLSLSVVHLSAPEIELKNGTRLKVRPVMNLGAGHLFGRDIKAKSIEPRVALQTDFASWQLEMMLNANFNQVFWFGLGARLQDAMIFATGVRLKNGLDISYAYDLSLSKLKRYNTGSHEVVVRYSLDLSREKPDKRYKSVRIL